MESHLYAVKYVHIISSYTVVCFIINVSFISCVLCTMSKFVNIFKKIISEISLKYSAKSCVVKVLNECLMMIQCESKLVAT